MQCYSVIAIHKLHQSGILFNVSVKVSPHKTFNSCKGVIRSPDIKYATEAEIVESFGSTYHSETQLHHQCYQHIYFDFCNSSLTQQSPYCLFVPACWLFYFEPFAMFLVSKIMSSHEQLREFFSLFKCGNHDHNSKDYKADARCVICKESRCSFSEDYSGRLEGKVI